MAILVTASSVLAEEEIAFVVSRAIIPYQDAAVGFKKELPDFDYQEYTLEEDSPDAILSQLHQNPPALTVAIGPEAAALLKEQALPSPQIFTMVLNPEKLFPDSPAFSGVSLNYPPGAVLSLIKKSFPDRKRVGIFFSPELNSSLVRDYRQHAPRVGLEIAPFPVAASSEVRSILTSPTFNPDIVLFIPDHAIIKEKLISYIIEECLFRKIPAVGFNAWFTKNGGAVVSLYVDYEEVGWQTAQLARTILGDKNLAPRVEPPQHLGVIVNLKIAQKFTIAVSPEIKAVADTIIE